MKEVISLMRIHHYIKNFLIFLPLFFSGNFFNKELIFINIIGFLSFSFLTSAVYIFNDICDVEKDKLHSVKCNRPIASEKISKRTAKILIIILLTISTMLSFIIWHKNLYIFLIMSMYALLNVLYSIKLKDIPIIDVAIIVSGFVLRLIYGGAISGIIISNWLYLVVIAFSFYMGFGKRRNEMLMQKEGTRKVLESYSVEFLDKNMYVSAILTIVFYTLWCIENSTKHIINLVFSVPLVMLIILKYNLNIQKNSEGDPVNVILNDKWLIFLTLIYGILLTFMVYL